MLEKLGSVLLASVLSVVFFPYLHLFWVVHVQCLKNITATLLLVGLGFNLAWRTWVRSFWRHPSEVWSREWQWWHQDWPSLLAHWNTGWMKWGPGMPMRRNPGQLLFGGSFAQKQPSWAICSTWICGKCNTCMYNPVSDKHSGCLEQTTPM